MVFLWFSYGFPMVTRGYQVVIRISSIHLAEARACFVPDAGARGVAPGWRARVSPIDRGT